MTGTTPHECTGTWIFDGTGSHGQEIFRCDECGTTRTLPSAQTPQQKRLASHAAIMGISVDELLTRLATWTPDPDDWAAEEAGLAREQDA